MPSEEGELKLCLRPGGYTCRSFTSRRTLGFSDLLPVTQRHVHNGLPHRDDLHLLCLYYIMGSSEPTSRKAKWVVLIAAS